MVYFYASFLPWKKKISSFKLSKIQRGVLIMEIIIAMQAVIAYLPGVKLALSIAKNKLSI